MKRFSAFSELGITDIARFVCEINLGKSLFIVEQFIQRHMYTTTDLTRQIPTF